MDMLFCILFSMLQKTHLPQKVITKVIIIFLLGRRAFFGRSRFIFLGWNNIIPLSTKILNELHYISLRFDGGGGRFLGRFPDLMDEYFRSLMKSFFSPVLIVVPI